MNGKESLVIAYEKNNTNLDKLSYLSNIGMNLHEERKERWEW